MLVKVSNNCRWCSCWGWKWWCSCCCDNEDDNCSERRQETREDEENTATRSNGGTTGVKSSSSTSEGNPRNKCALQPGHSLMDWIRLGASGKDLTGVGAKAGHLAVTIKELSKHDKEKDAWLAIRGKVYNVSAYLSFHPGGQEELMKGAGKDATTLFDQVHPWVNYEQILQKCLVGRLVTVDPSISLDQTIFNSKSPVLSPLSNKSSSPNIPSSPVALNNNNNNRNQVDDASESAQQQFDDRDALCLPRFDWIQTSNSVTVIFYTNAFSNPLLEIYRSEEGVLILITYSDTVHSNEISFHKEVEWPCLSRISGETGKVELVFRKHSNAIWDNYGVLRQTTKASGANSANVKYSYKVKEKMEVNYNTVLIKLERTDDSKMVAPIGKHVRVFATINGLEMSRSYTPVPESLFHRFAPNSATSATTNDTSICLMVKRYPTGNVSRYLTDKSPGDVVQITKPIGDFDLARLERREAFLLLAAGTGITPMMALLIFLLERRIKKCQFVRLMFFNRTEADILFRDKLDQLSREERRLQVTYVLSEPSATWPGLTGHIGKDMVLDAVTEHIRDTGYTIQDVFSCVCGPTAFTNLAKAVLGEVGIAPAQYHAFQG